MHVFRGSGVALITPFREDKSIDYPMLERLVERQIAGGTDALIVCGTTGEPATLSGEERADVIRCVVLACAGRIPVIAGCGSNATQQAVANAREAQKLGADALLVVTPYYNKATQSGLCEHFKCIANAVELPMLLYNVPSRTGCNLLPETIAQLAELCDNIVGVKEASGNISQIAKLAELTRGRLDLYSGNDDQVVPVMSLGGAGVISVLANLLPASVHAMTAAYLNQEAGKALELQLSLLNVARALFMEVNPIPIKAAMRMIGYDCGGLRLPLTELEETHKIELYRVLSACNCPELQREMKLQGGSEL